MDLAVTLVSVLGLAVEVIAPGNKVIILHQELR